MPRKWYEGSVKQIEQLGTHTKRFVLEVIDEDIFTFVEGQFITFDLPIGEKRLERWRSYSIASMDRGNTIIELCIVQLEGGRASTFFHQEVQVGSILKFKGPEGSFVLPEVLPQELIMICTGTGIAPFRAMIQKLYKGPNRPQHLHLIFGTRYEQDLLYRTEFEQLAHQYDTFKYTQVLSREDHWQGYKGYVHQVYETEYQIVQSNRLFYLCGWSQMVDQAAQILKNIGYAPSQIKVELYG